MYWAINLMINCMLSCTSVECLCQFLMWLHRLAYPLSRFVPYWFILELTLDCNFQSNVIWFSLFYCYTYQYFLDRRVWRLSRIGFGNVWLVCVGFLGRFHLLVVWRTGRVKIVYDDTATIKNILDRTNKSNNNDFFLYSVWGDGLLLLFESDENIIIKLKIPESITLFSKISCFHQLQGFLVKQM